MAQDIKEGTTRGTPEQAREMYEAQQQQQREQNAENARQLKSMERAEKIDEVRAALHYGGSKTPDHYESRIAAIAVDRNFTKGGKAESAAVDSAQAHFIALAADFMANMSAAETLQYAVQNGMVGSMSDTKGRNAVRYAAAVEGVSIYMKEHYPEVKGQDVNALVQAAVPIARDMVKERQ